MTFRIKFYCWYCRADAAKDNLDLPLDRFESSCSVSQSDCGNALVRIVSENAFGLGGAHWIPVEKEGHLRFPDMKYDPFVSDLRAFAKLTDSVARFLYGDNLTRFQWDQFRFPSFRKARFPVHLSTDKKFSVHCVGETLAVKFMTLSGIAVVRSSYHVYFAPFRPNLWFTLLASICITLAAEVILVRLANSGRSLPLFSMASDLLYWKLSSFAGQFRSSRTPSFTLSEQDLQPERSSKGFLFATTSWSIAITMIMNNYGAFFSAESLRSFPYTTGYKHMTDLENFTLYFLLNEQKIMKLPCLQNLPRMRSRCVRIDPKLVFPNECVLADYIASQHVYYEKRLWKMKKDCGGTTTADISSICQSSNAMSGLQKRFKVFRGLDVNSFPLKNDPTAIDRTIEATISKGKAAAFVSYVEDFRGNWAIFTDVMRRHPDWKIANNFESGDKFGVRIEFYQFTAGLHERHTRRFEGRLQLLLGSGIYELWNKWQKIRVGMSGPRHEKKSEGAWNGLPGDPMSFENSAIAWLFWAQYFAWAAACATLFVEAVLIRLPSWECWPHMVFVMSKRYYAP